MADRSADGKFAHGNRIAFLRTDFHQTAEARQKIADALRGRPRSELTRMRISTSMLRNALERKTRQLNALKTEDR